MKFRTNERAVDRLVREVERQSWSDWEHAIWVLTFVIQLVRLAATARRANARGLKAAQRLAWDLGQLVSSPQWVRQQEQQHQDHKRSMYELALENKRVLGVAIRPEELWSEQSAAAAVKAAVDDTLLINSFARRLLKLFGVRDQVRQAMIDMHTPYSRDKALFEEDAWQEWWTWAEREFFAGEKDSATN